MPARIEYVFGVPPPSSEAGSDSIRCGASSCTFSMVGYTTEKLRETRCLKMWGETIPLDKS